MTSPSTKRTLGAPGGKSTLSLPVPNDPGLIGLPIYWQSLMTQTPGGNGFANVWGDKVQ